MKTYEALITRYFEQVDEGQSVDVQAIVESNPEHAGQLRAFFSNIGVIDDLVRDAQPPRVTESDQVKNLHVSGIDGVSTGQQVGKYLVHEIVGHGAFGTVFRATDIELQREVALKVPRPEVMLDRGRLRRFQAEATTAAKLDNPMIVPVLDAQLKGRKPYIASTFCHGPDFGHWLARQTAPIEWKQAAAFTAKLADAVHYAHEQGVLHRDLKPGNIMVESVNHEQPNRCHGTDGNLALLQPRLTDFGLAKLVKETLGDTRSSVIVGTPLYMAPEQIEPKRNQTSPATDVFALGTILFELISGETPYEGVSYIELLDRSRSGDVPRLADRCNEVDEDLAVICDKARQSNPSDRYASAHDFGVDLRRYRDGKPILGKRISAITRLLRWLQDPSRISQAGAYLMAFALFSIFWMCLGFFSTYREVLTQINQSAMHLVIAVCTFLSPAALIGWYTLRHRSWAIKAGLVHAVASLPFAVSGMMSTPWFFSELYNGNLTFQRFMYAHFFVGYLLQLTLFLFAYVADRKRNSRVS